jgi:hypothetical protein
MRLLLTTAAIILSSFGCFAQFETDYKPLESKGTLPADFVTLSSEKYNSDKETIKNEKGRARRVKDQFLLESNFELDNLLLGGKIVFNDPMSVYVNKVADKILSKDKETRDKLRFYILKSTAVNAFSTNQGIICVNVGLLAQLENEAQLAYILCHEIEHYKNKHSINKAVERDKIERGVGAYQTFTKKGRYEAECLFSKEEEMEADLKGYDLFKTTGYSSTTLNRVFDVLKYSYLPFDDITFDKSFLEDTFYKLPSRLVLRQTKEINTSDEGENPKSTHPSTRLRREKVMGKIAKAGSTGSDEYLVSKTEFETLRTSARFELSRLYLLSRDYEMSIYNSYMLLRKYPKNIYLRKSVLQALTLLAAYSNEGSFNDVHGKYDDVEGKSQAVFYLFAKMDSTASQDIAAMALNYAARLKRELPGDKDIDAFTIYIVYLLIKHERELDYFSSERPKVIPGSVVDTAASVAPVKTDSTKVTAKKDERATDEEGSKYDKIKKQVVQQKEEEKAGKSYYAQYALASYYDDAWVKPYFDTSRTAHDGEKTVLLISDNTYQDEDEKLIIEKRSTVSSENYDLGIDRVLVINPFFASFNANKKHKVRYLKSEGGQRDFGNRLKKCANAAKVDIEILDSRNLSTADIDKMNDLSLLGDYIRERLGQSVTSVPNIDRSRILALAQKYNTNYFLWSGAASYTDMQNKKIGLGIMTALLPYMLPFTLQYLINGGHYTYYYNLMYDVKTDRVKMENFRSINTKTNGTILNSHIYDTFQQIHSKKAHHKSKTKKKKHRS